MKKLLLVSLATALVVSITSCGGDSSSGGLNPDPGNGPVKPGQLGANQLPLPVNMHTSEKDGGAKTVKLKFTVPDESRISKVKYKIVPLKAGKKDYWFKESYDLAGATTGEVSVRAGQTVEETINYDGVSLDSFIIAWSEGSGS